MFWETVTSLSRIIQNSQISFYIQDGNSGKPLVSHQDSSTWWLGKGLHESLLRGVSRVACPRGWVAWLTSRRVSPRLTRVSSSLARVACKMIGKKKRQISKEENDLAGQGSQVAAGIQVEGSLAAGGSPDQGTHLHPHLQVVNICVTVPWPAFGKQKIL